MSERPVNKLNELYKEFLAGRIDRRQLMLRASTLGLSAAGMAMFMRGVPASAQDATPEASPAAIALPGGFKSLTREEYRAMLAEDYPFTATEQPAGGTLILGSIASSNLTTVNAFFADNFPTQDINILMFESLWGIYPDPAKNAELSLAGHLWVPGLADSFEIAEDGKTYTFHLNPNANFHDGTPVTAQDLVMVADAQADETSGSSYTSQFLGTLKSWTAVDDKTFQWETVDVFPQIVVFPNIWLPILPSSVWGDVPYDQWQTDPGSTGTDPSRVVGSGPFKFVEINEGEGTTTMVRNDDYWDTKAAAETVIFQVWPDDTASVEALRSGELDMLMDQVPPADVEGLQGEDSLSVEIYDSYQFGFFGYNLDPEKTPLFQDVKVRQALIYALDRQAMVDSLLLGYGVVANGTQPTLSEAYAPDQINTVYNYDVDKANQLLDEAGWTANSDGIREKDGTKLSFEIMYGAASTNDQLAAAVQDYWKAVGVEGKPTSVDFDTVLLPAITETFEYQMAMLAFDWASPSGDQSAMFGTSSYGTGFNFMKYSNPAYDEANTAASATLDPQERFDLLVKASNIVNDDAPVIINWFRANRTGYNKRMVNFTPISGGLLWSLPWVTVSE
ncbi:MAG TPA: ABC transporter substrate-binding protein [Thermomicrobiales bacterium]|nr:ABC transporter substrate-binding protein [Thermomicrobiales bacterium]